MGKYLLIESRDLFESKDVDYTYELASNLAKEGNEVTVFLVQNGVLSARSSPSTESTTRLTQKVTVLADEFSLRQRGIQISDLIQGINPAKLDIVIDKLADGCKVVWH